MNKGVKPAARLHSKVPANWYYQSIKPQLSWHWLFQWYWHNRRFQEVGKLIEKKDGQILDIGSADGVFTKKILDISGVNKVIGIDVLEKSVDWAKNHWKDDRLEFRVADTHDLPFSPETFDAVFALEVLEHVSSPEIVMAEVRRVLKKNGYAIFLVPSDNLLFRILWDNFWTKTRGEIWDDTHIQTYRNNYLVTLSKESGFKIEKDKKFIFGMLHLVKVRKS